jgi:hypothetical protein
MIALILITFYIPLLLEIIYYDGGKEAFFNLIHYAIHYPIFIIGTISTFCCRRYPAGCFKVLVAMQILLIIDLILFAIALVSLLYVVLFYTIEISGEAFVLAYIFHMSYIVFVSTASLFYYFYFKRFVIEGATIPASDFTTNVYIPFSDQNGVS